MRAMSPSTYELLRDAIESGKAIKCLTGLQPWFYLLVHGGKWIENRPWQSDYRGLVLLTASTGSSIGSLARQREYHAGVSMQFDNLRAPPLLPPFEQIPRGGIIGAAQIVDILPRHFDADRVEQQYPGREGGWKFDGQFGFVLEDRIVLPFTPCKGALNLWPLVSTSDAYRALAKALGIGGIDLALGDTSEEPVQLTIQEGEK